MMGGGRGCSVAGPHIAFRWLAFVGSSITLHLQVRIGLVLCRVFDVFLHCSILIVTCCIVFLVFTV